MGSPGFLFWAIASALFLLDLGTKYWVRSAMPLGSEIPVLPFFSLVHIQNTGVAFGLFQGRNLFFLLFGLIVVGGLVWYGLKTLHHDRALGLVLAVVIGGALGNLLDRAFHGRVTDFLDFYFRQNHWPAFNVADSAICIGAGLLIFHSLRTSKGTKP